MLQTIEAIYDPEQGLRFSENINIQKPVRVLVTILGTASAISKKGTAQTLCEVLRAHPLTNAACYSDTKIEMQVNEIRASWE